MKNSFELANVSLWAIAIIATAFLTRGSSVFTYLGPLYAVCMIGSVIIVRKARGIHT